MSVGTVHNLYFLLHEKLFKRFLFKKEMGSRNYCSSQDEHHGYLIASIFICTGMLVRMLLCSFGGAARLARLQENFMRNDTSCLDAEQTSFLV